MIVLDTNVLSELMRPQPNANVVAWLNRHADDEILMTAVTWAELLFGVVRLPVGRRQADLQETVVKMFVQNFVDRVAPFDEFAAPHFAEFTALRQRAGRPIVSADAQIAAICRSIGAQLATRNTQDFEGLGLALVNPWLDDSVVADG